jgi:hypothetical protein
MVVSRPGSNPRLEERVLVARVHPRRTSSCGLGSNVEILESRSPSGNSGFIGRS